MKSLHTSLKNCSENPFEPVRHIPNITDKLGNFILNEFLETGLPSCEQACEMLDLIENILVDNIPAYKKIVIENLGIRSNPNKNKE